MAIWLNRAGARGEYEVKFLQETRIFATWEHLDVDLGQMQSRDELVRVMRTKYPEAKDKTIANWASQVWPFAHDMKPGDLVVVPLKSQRAVQVGEITSDYRFEASAADPFYHYRQVKWVGEAIPRVNFGKDLLHTLGAFMTICRVQRNNAEKRLLAMRASGWKPEALASVVTAKDADADALTEDTDLEEAGRDQIARLIAARFQGHGLTRLVEAILRAQGYTTYRSPEGADGGVDILAGAGPLGFGSPRLCVEVKSESGPTDRPTVDKLMGAVSKFQADEGLFVAWGGFRNNVQKDLAASFFRMRLWTQKDLEQLFAHYDQFDEDLKAELPLKRVWTVAAQGEE
jgi:restriction system protein